MNWYTSYTDETTNVPLTGKMNPGTYTLTETKAPAGYARSNEIWTVEILSLIHILEWYSNPECTIPITTAEMAAITPDTTTAYYFL